MEKSKKESIDKFVCCSCHSDEHIIRVLWEEEDPDLGYIHYLLAPAPFPRRIWLAIKYIFGFQSRYGMFGELVLDSKNSKEIIDVLSKIRPRP